MKKIIFSIILIFALVTSAFPAGPTGGTGGTGMSEATYTSGGLIKTSVGGTGVANGSNNTITFTGNFTFGVTLTGNTSVTFPETGTLAVTTQIPTAATLHVDDILTALGIASEATHSGTYTGSTIADNQTFKAAIQALETAVEAKLSTSSAASYTEPGSNIPLCRTGAGTLGGCTNVTDVAFSGYAALAGTNTFTGANTIGDGGDDQIIKIQRNATNEKYSGIVQDFTYHETIAFGQPVVINSDGEVALANADTPATLLPAIGLAVVGGNAAATCTVLFHGSATDTDWNWTPGATIYVDDSAAGVLTATIGDITTGNGVQVIGVAIHADSILVMPSLSIAVLE